ncbi:RNA helicase Mov10l1-like [Rhopilema esculentum]|uniref:RNA helicase Mov10l1-like n=1 Tax=Rhopilema esculentum TaxID=499914 RepID=UPI0031CE1F73|eukprot:gene2280-17893_t
MFGLLSRLYHNACDFVVGVTINDEALPARPIANSLNHSDAEKPKETSDTATNAETIRKEDAPNITEAKATENDISLSKAFDGVVTALYSGRGLIDDHIYFSQETVVGNIKLQIGTKVSVEASRTNEQGGWVATKLQVFNEWNTEQEEVESVTEINGIITYFKNVSGLINNKHSFSRASCLNNYYPMVNDFVLCKIRNANGLENEVVAVEPLREKQFVGVVTSIMNRYGFIDDDIYFPFGACRGYTPKLSHWVLVTAIESNQRRSQWRAMRVEKCTEDMKKKFGGSSSELKDSASGAYMRGRGYGYYQRPRASNVRNGREQNMVLPGQRPTRKKKMFLPKHLKSYEVPLDIKDCILSGKQLEDVVPDVVLPLSMENHRPKLDALLFAEEIEMEEEMREFDLEKVTLRQMGEYLVLAVPGLAEGRPSVLIGDKILLDITDSPLNSPRYEGCVHEVRAEDVLLKFSQSFHDIYRSEDCDVQFFFNRTTIRRCHQAVEYGAELGKEVLFPTVLNKKPPLTQNVRSRRQTELVFYNKHLNQRQQAAVRRIVAAQGRPTPYLLFGPPGTGKTVTLVEAILQINKTLRFSRILACAPSNSASDLIAQRLVESKQFSKGELIRLNAFQRSQEIPELIEDYCTNDTDDIMLTCRYRVIVCTCSMAGILYCAGLQSGHFTHVFVDEAGQCTEPECLVAAGMLAGNEDGQMVLAGDPFQLGPVLQSGISLRFGLGTSMLERLISRSLYARNEIEFADDGCYNPLLVTKLVNNYRSHESLLNLSSTLFYHGELRPFAKPELINSFIDADFLPNKKFPLIFHGVRGEDMREGNSPSWFNPAEVLKVMKYVQHVISQPGKDVSLDEIGIITPYRKQVEKIRLVLESVNLQGIKVGSVEEFQGQERQIIIISTVRSNESFVTFDQRHALGFLSNPKRFNVAITRAQALLIVIGNPHILCRDPYWCSLVQYSVANSAFTGCELPSLVDPNIKDSFDTALTMLGVAPNNTDEVPDSANVTGEKVVPDSLDENRDDPTASRYNRSGLKFDNESEDSWT